MASYVLDNIKFNERQGLFSLISVEPFAFHRFHYLSRELGRFQEYSRLLPDNQAIAPIDADSRRAYLVFVEKMLGPCEEIGFNISSKSLQWLRLAITTDPTCNHASVQSQLDTISNAIYWEAEEILFFHLDKGKAKYFKDPWQSFNLQVVAKYPKLIKDIEEASKCYAAQRNTACVFHLMRIMEEGLRILAAKLQVPLTIPNWDGILRRIDSELQKRHGDKTQDWLAIEGIISEAASHLRTVKTVWRNPTMHVESKYTDEEALEIYNAVRVFMGHLAAKL